MSALGFLVAPPWMGLLHLAHLAVLLAAVVGVAGASGRGRAFAAVVLLASVGWVASVVLSAVIYALPAGAASPPVLAWAPIVVDVPMWAAVVFGAAVCWRGGGVRG